MPEKTHILNPPTGILRILLRLPIWLYKAHLGWILGGRFLMVDHTGRESGKTRHTVLEVVGHDGETGEYYVAAGFGEKSDWLQNIEKTPSVIIYVAGRHFPARGKRLGAKRAGDVLQNYARAHPVAMKELTRILGYRWDGTEDDLRSLAACLPMLSFRPE